MFSISFADGLFFLEVEAYDGLVGLFYGFLLLDAFQVLLLVLRDLLLCGMDIVAKPSPCAREARGLSRGHAEGIEAVRHRDDAVDATSS
jgi:hypothetical protein